MYDALSLLPGVAHAVTTIVVGYPFDVVKTRLQTGKDVNLVASTKKLLSRGNIYRGCSVPLVSLMIKRPFEFLLFESMSKKMNSPIVGGLIAGTASAVFGCPFSVIKVKTQLTQKTKVTAIIRQMYQESGYRSFFQGIVPSIVMGAPAASLYLGAYGSFREKIPVVWWSPAVCGILSSIITWTVLIPVDTVKTNVQGVWRSGKVEVPSVMATIRQINRVHGILGFWRGWLASVARAIPSSACAMTAYELVRRNLPTNS